MERSPVEEGSNSNPEVVDSDVRVALRAIIDEFTASRDDKGYPNANAELAEIFRRNSLLSPEASQVEASRWLSDTEKILAGLDPNTRAELLAQGRLIDD